MSDIFKSLPKVVYHGTTSHRNQYLSLTNISTISLTKGNPRTDFGQGFYVTSVYEQALAFARCRANFANDRKTTPLSFDRPIILKYQLNTEDMKKFNGIILSSANEQWAEFIFNNRVGEKWVMSSWHNLKQTYNYVYGHVADGKVARLATQYKYDRVDLKQFCQEIQPKFPSKNDQLSFHIVTILGCLEFLEVIEDGTYRYPRR
jgi:hypothetical protein